MHTYRQRLIQGKHTDIDVQLPRYLATAAVAFVIDFGFFLILTQVFKLHYLPAGGVSFTLGLVSNYLMSTRWVFARRRISVPTIEFGAFSLLAAGGLALNLSLLWFFTEAIGWHYIVSKLLAIGIGFFYSFFSKRYLLFG